jgi:hypothetical protein
MLRRVEYQIEEIELPDASAQRALDDAVHRFRREGWDIVNVLDGIAVGPGRHACHMLIERALDD